MTLPGLGPKEMGFFAPNWSPGSGTFSIAGVPGPAKHAPVTVHVLPAGPLPTNAYLLTDPGRSSEAVLIDAPEDIWEPVQEILAREGCRLTALWITHGHWDHIQGAAEVVRRAQVPVLAHAADKTLLLDPQVMMRYLGAGLRLEAVPVTRWIAAGEKLPIGAGLAEVRHVPGHCPGNILFYIPELGAAFVGDALFAGSVGRTDLPGGSAETLAESIRTQIYTLPDATVVYPGHGPSTTVGAEKRFNPYVRA